MAGKLRGVPTAVRRTILWVTARWRQRKRQSVARRVETTSTVVWTQLDGRNALRGAAARELHPPTQPRTRARSSYLSLKALIRSLYAPLSRAYTPCASAWTIASNEVFERVNDGPLDE